MISKIALALAVTLGAASAASAASQHAVSHHRSHVAQHRAPAAAYNSYGFAASPTVRTGPGVSPEDQGPYDPYNHQQVKCIGGSCAPEWGLDDGE
jgi:hypothetical protein